MSEKIKFVTISLEVAELCSKLIRAEKEKIKIMDFRNKYYRQKLEKSESELNGNYSIDIEELLKRINYGR